MCEVLQFRSFPLLEIHCLYLAVKSHVANDCFLSVHTLLAKCELLCNNQTFPLKYRLTLAASKVLHSEKWLHIARTYFLTLYGHSHIQVLQIMLYLLKYREHP